MRPPILPTRTLSFARGPGVPLSAGEGKLCLAKLTEGVRLLTWGDPLLEAWLGAIRGAPLTDADYRVSGLARDADPFTL
jgi:hypothetical protein